MLRLSRLLLLMVVMASFIGKTLAQDSRVDACRKLMTNTAPSDAVMQILEPAGDVTIYGNELTVRVALPVNDPKIDHWHLWSDGQLQLMIYGTATTIELTPGRHEICAILGHTDHADVGTPDAITVTVIEAGEGTPTTSPSEIALQSAASSTSVVEGDNTGQMVLVIVAALAAAVGGWFVGSRLPKSRK